MAITVGSSPAPLPKNGVASARPSTGSSLSTGNSSPLFLLLAPARKHLPFPSGIGSPSSSSLADVINNATQLHATSAGGSVVPGSRIGPFSMPACPLQPDLDLLHRFRQKENEYSRERNASPFRWIDRYRPRSTLFFFFFSILASLPSSSSSLTPTLSRRGRVGTARRGGRPSLSPTAMIPQTKILRYGTEPIPPPTPRAGGQLINRAIVCFLTQRNATGSAGRGRQHGALFIAGCSARADSVRATTNPTHQAGGEVGPRIQEVAHGRAYIPPPQSPIIVYRSHLFTFWRTGNGGKARREKGGIKTERQQERLQPIHHTTARQKGTPPPASFNGLHIVNPITGIVVCVSQQQKKDTFSRKASAPDKLSISEHSPRQPRTRSVYPACGLHFTGHARHLDRPCSHLRLPFSLSLFLKTGHVQSEEIGARQGQGDKDGRRLDEAPTRQIGTQAALASARTHARSSSSCVVADSSLALFRRSYPISHL